MGILISILFVDLAYGQCEIELFQNTQVTPNAVPLIFLDVSNYTSINYLPSESCSTEKHQSMSSLIAEKCIFISFIYK